MRLRCAACWDWMAATSAWDSLWWGAATGRARTEPRGRSPRLSGVDLQLTLAKMFLKGHPPPLVPLAPHMRAVYMISLIGFMGEAILPKDACAFPVEWRRRRRQAAAGVRAPRHCGRPIGGASDILTLASYCRDRAELPGRPYRAPAALLGR